MMIILAALLIQLILLKNVSSSCTYSIGLGNMFTYGWDGSYLTVNAGATSTQFTRDSSQLNPVWHDFQIQSGDQLSVDFTSVQGGLNPAFLFYTVMDAPQGGGNVVYEFMPLIATIPNLCTEECDYSIKLYAGSNRNMWRADNYGTVYLNGIPIIPRLIINNSQQTQIYNFGTTIQPTDVITVQRPELFYDQMAYEVYMGDIENGALAYVLRNNDAGPPGSKVLKNYCGLNNQLAVSIPSNNAPPGRPFPVTVLKYIPTLTKFPVKVILVCGSQVKTEIVDVATSFNFEIPGDFRGFCYFYASTVYYFLYQFLDSANVPIFIANVVSPLPGDLTFIPSQQQSEVVRAISIPGNRFSSF